MGKSQQKEQYSQICKKYFSMQKERGDKKDVSKIYTTEHWNSMHAFFSKKVAQEQTGRCIEDQAGSNTGPTPMTQTSFDLFWSLSTKSEKHCKQRRHKTKWMDD